MTSHSDSPAWTRIRDGVADPVILAVDFDGSGRREATFRDFAKILPGEFPVWHAVAPPDDGDTPLAPDQYVDRWLALPGGPRTGVQAVFGYCAGSVFASALADALGGRDGARPPVVLFNPGVPTVATLDRDFGGVVAGLTILTDDERAVLQGRAGSIRKDHGEDFPEVCRQYLALYLEACATSFERFGIDAEVGAELTQLFRRYIRYLAAADDIGYRDHWGQAIALTAREQAGNGFAAEERVLDLTRADLLRDTTTAQLTFRLLRAGAEAGHDR
jgi:hypothetical protein